MKRKIKIEQIIWIFVLGCLLGFGIETLWHFIKNQVWINKQGLLYGPFKPIYGFGAVLLTLILVPMRNKKTIKVFIYGVIIGTVFEYLCSVVQEVLWGTYTWTYANFDYSISSRIYLPYCLLWGAIAVFWIQAAYPIIEYLLSKIHPFINTILVTGLAIFMVFNLTVTAMAMDRYSKRYYGVTAKNNLQRWVDKTYNDEVMKQKFPKLRIYKK